MMMFIVSQILLTFLMISLYGESGLHMLYRHTDLGGFQLMPFLFLLILFWIGLWSYLARLQAVKQMGPLILTRLEDKRIRFFLLAQRPMWGLSVTNGLLVFLFLWSGLVTLSNPSVLVLSVILTWLIWGAVVCWFIWRGLSIRITGFILAVSFAFFEFLSLKYKTETFLVFYSAKNSTTPAFVLMMKMSILLAIYVVTYRAFRKYEEIGVEKDDYR